MRHDRPKTGSAEAPAGIAICLLSLALWGVAGCGDDADGVGPDVGAEIAFQTQPTNGPERGLLGPVEVVVRDASGEPIVEWSDPVSLALGSAPGDGTLHGTVTVDAVEGVATFDDLRVDDVGSGYTLVASAGELSEVESSPFDVLRSSPLAVGVWHVCVVRSGGAAYCWGLNTYGQLGDGTGTNRNAPVAVSTELSFSSLAPSNFHTCGLTSEGEGYCWGAGSYGRLGDGTDAQHLTPVPVTGGHTFASISAGLDHSCAVDVVARDVYCWGRNQYGQRGDGTTSPSTEPVPVHGSSILDFDVVSAGRLHTCAIDTGGSGYCWGLNNQGQLGDGSTATRFVPTSVSGDLGFGMLATNDNDAGLGWDTTCGVTDSSEAYCWGRNNRGQLGGGTTGGQSTQPEPVFGGLEFGSVSAGADHSCGVTFDGAAYCWGGNQYGQLGNGTAGVDEDSNTPSLVAGEHVFAHVGAGQTFSCGLTTGGEVYCWGVNQYGQLGDGTNTSRSEPVLVEGLPAPY